jgi:hypothetical protein
MMKNLSLTLLALFLLTTLRAQVIPNASTSDQPIWYFIQVTEASTGSNLVCTVGDDNILYGKAQVSTTDATAAASQLWRFEKVGDGLYTVINKSTGTYLGYKYDSNLLITKACVQQNANRFKFVGRGTQFGICATTPGANNALYLGLTSLASLNGMMVELTEEQSLTASGLLTFPIFNDTPFKTSVSTSEYWYNIISAKSGTSNLAIKDNSNAGGAFPFVITTLDENDNSQQWKFIKNEANDKMDIVNRATGLHIMTNSTPEGLFNAVMAGYFMKNTGYNFEYLGLGQYALNGLENDYIERYLALQDTQAKADSLNLSAMPNSEFSWTLKEAGFTSGINNTSEAKPAVQVVNGTIVVENATDYTVTSASGIVMPKSVKLQKGVYLVTIGKTTTKVIIN